MAEGWAHHPRGDVIEAHSAGTERHGLNPNAVKVMPSRGLDIRRPQSMTAIELTVREFA